MESLATGSVTGVAMVILSVATGKAPLNKVTGIDAGCGWKGSLLFVITAVFCTPYAYNVFYAIHNASQPRILSILSNNIGKGFLGLFKGVLQITQAVGRLAIVLGECLPRWISLPDQ